METNESNGPPLFVRLPLIIENHIIAFLRSFSVWRSRLILRIFPTRILLILEKTLLFHLSILLSTVSIIVSVFRQTRTITLLSMHPVLMSLGAFLFLGEGLVCYRNKFLMDSFSPIMAKGKRTKNRALHHGLQSFTLVFLLLGLLFIWASEIKLQGSVLPRTVHSFCGYVTILAVLTQAGQGMKKLFEIENKSSRQIKSVGIWHADFGLLIWDFICFTIILGAGLFLGIANASLYVVVCIVGVTWVSLHMQMRRKGPDGSQSHAFLGPNNQTGAPTSGDDSALDSKEACTSLLVQPEEDFSL